MKDDKRKSDQNFEDNIIESKDEFNKNREKLIKKFTTNICLS